MPFDVDFGTWPPRGSTIELRLLEAAAEASRKSVEDHFRSNPLPASRMSTAEAATVVQQSPDAQKLLSLALNLAKAGEVIATWADDDDDFVADEDFEDAVLQVKGLVAEISAYAAEAAGQMSLNIPEVRHAL
jgi:hypothetical protein